MTNGDGLNAESLICIPIKMTRNYDLHPNQDNKELCSNYERHYGRLHYNAEMRAERQGQVDSNQHQTPIISNQTKVDNLCTLMLNIFSKYNLNSFI